MGRTEFLGATLSIGAAILLLCSAATAEDTPDGAELYQYCGACHGDNGEGNQSFHAPAIAGLPAWYVEAQLKGFRSGLRGTHFDDLEGMRMRPMTRTLDEAARGTPFEANVTAVSAYVAAMPATNPEPTLEGGDATKGAAAYALCASCHGVDGKGNEPQHAPPLVGTSDWYMLTQLRKFKAGIRGWRPDDTWGGVMRGMSMTLADDQAMKDIIAHIQTLSN